MSVNEVCSCSVISDCGVGITVSLCVCVIQLIVVVHVTMASVHTSVYLVPLSHSTAARVLLVFSCCPTTRPVLTVLLSSVPTVFSVRASIYKRLNKTNTKIEGLTLSLLIPLSLYTLPYWSNLLFLLFDIWALWRQCT